MLPAVGSELTELTELYIVYNSDCAQAELIQAMQALQLAA
jgi:hypothetical protein